MRVLVTGTFDIPHAGHANFLRLAARLGDDLIVGVLSDEFVEKYKKEKPLFNEEERAILVGGITDQPTFVVRNQRAFFRNQGIPDATVIAVGSDWARKDYLSQIEVTQDELDYWGFSVAYVPYTENMSTTEIKRRILDAYASPAAR